MPLEHSPSLSDFAEGMPPASPDPGRGHRWAYLAMAALSILLGALLVISLVQRGVVAHASGRGTITGLVLDASGRPTVAEVMIERTELLTRSDTNGHFVLPQVPAGERLLVVANDGLGVEYPIVAIAGASVDIGTVRVETTAVPLP